MITLESDTLVFRFPEVHEKARTEIEFQITLRIPDDTNDYPLPPGLGRFPLRHTEDFRTRLPSDWSARGGVMMPLHRAEAMWISFRQHANAYPCAVKIAAGKINAISGKPWSLELDGSDIDYVVSPGQPWLDGFCVGKGQIRQFVAMPLGQGFTAEEQITGTAEWGGLQIVVYPMRRERWEKLAAERAERERLLAEARARQRKKAVQVVIDGVAPEMRSLASSPVMAEACAPARAAPVAMGLGAGGRMRQEIQRDPYGIGAWDRSVSSRCFVAMIDAADWPRITGEEMRRKPPTAKDYARAGLPWFDWEAKGQEVLAGAPALSALSSVTEVLEAQGADPLPDNDPIPAGPVVTLGPGQGASLPPPAKTGP